MAHPKRDLCAREGSFKPLDEPTVPNVTSYPQRVAAYLDVHDFESREMIGVHEYALWKKNR